MDSLLMDYDPDTDVVRVRTDSPIKNSVAVPLEDLTILVSQELDQVVGVNIDDLRSFVRRYVSDRLVPPAAEGEDLFNAAKPHLCALMQMFTRNLGPVVKDRVVHWYEFVSSVIRQAQAAP